MAQRDVRGFSCDVDLKLWRGRVNLGWQHRSHTATVSSSTHIPPRKARAIKTPSYVVTPNKSLRRVLGEVGVVQFSHNSAQYRQKIAGVSLKTAKAGALRPTLAGRGRGRLLRRRQLPRPLPAGPARHADSD